MEKKSRRAVILLSGICLWIFFIFQEELSRYGLYSLISYNVHEIASFIPFLCIGTAIIWCVYLIVRMVRKQCDRYDRIFIVILLAIVILLGNYIYKWSNTGSVSVIASVESVDIRTGEVVIKDSEGRTVKLQSPEMINRIIETDGQEYLITYSVNADRSGMYRLFDISLLDN